MLFPRHIRKLSYASTIRGNECLCLIQGLFPTIIQQPDLRPLSWKMTFGAQSRTWLTSVPLCSYLHAFELGDEVSPLSCVGQCDLTTRN